MVWQAWYCEKTPEYLWGLLRDVECSTRVGLLTGLRIVLDLDPLVVERWSGLCQALVPGMTVLVTDNRTRALGHR